MQPRSMRVMPRNDSSRTVTGNRMMKLSDSVTQIRFGAYGAIIAMFLVVLSLSSDGAAASVAGWAAVGMLFVVAGFFVISGIRKMFNRMDNPARQTGVYPHID